MIALETDNRPDLEGAALSVHLLRLLDFVLSLAYFRIVALEKSLPGPADPIKSLIQSVIERFF